jgi:phosphate-selective porin OprO/OprP
VLDLNYHAGDAGTLQATDAVRGGLQKIWTLGLNWYPNTVFHFALDYEFINVDRLSATGGDNGVKANAVALRSQFAF